MTNKDGWFNQTAEQWQKSHDIESIKAYGKTSEEMPKPMRELTDEEFKALQDKSRRYK